MAPKRILITAVIISPPFALPDLTTTAPTHIIRDQEQKLTVCNIPVPTPFTSASPLLMTYCLSMFSVKDLTAKPSPTKAYTVFICEIVCNIHVRVC